ncbi:MAG: hypothetical protein IKR49_06500 [Clostridia bacterium]|nr:hypothetical protein [Clostridia bacterium]
MDDIYSAVLDRLSTLGVDGIGSNDNALTFAIARARERILNDINHQEVPEELRYTFIDMAAGTYLYDLKAMGLLQLHELDYATAPAKQIKEGDVQITFASAADGSLTPEARLDRLIHTLMHPDPALLASFRRMVW